MNKVLILIFLLFGFYSYPQHTEVQYLSGRGSADMVEWDFYCTDGMNSGEWTKIGVPSCWELQGFGKYDYGFAKDGVRGKESGLYRRTFTVPDSWKDKAVYVVFEGVMTDAEVKINGTPAGEKHQGAFYAFRFDISDKLNYGSENLIEVKVDKHSSDASVNAAEREGDFWIFGGVFRPVRLEAKPATHIHSIAVEAGYDGSFRSEIEVEGAADKITVQLYDPNGEPFGEKIEKNISGDRISLSGSFDKIQSWNSENPHLYRAEFSVYHRDSLIHRVSEKTGFRTVEVRERDGIYINGVKMKFKGVNRHSFRPESGRTLSPENSAEDVLLMKEMNMNAVRMSHYPPDDHFLAACDSLGLYVIDELAGWHGRYNTDIGRKLVKEMVEHDRNHPSVVIWANGNEGGSNPDLDEIFEKYDLQKRVVIHPWELHNGIETQHYRQYNYGVGNYDNGRDIVMPTEFLHGWFDGGHGAGLEDYWNMMWNEPLHAGGFLWDFADQGVVRKDLRDSLDTDHYRGADGIVGPYHEKEGSFFTIKEVWSPVFVERREITADFNGIFHLENRYHFTNLNTCSFSWKLEKWRKDDKKLNGEIPAPDVEPLQKGTLKMELPAGWKDFDVLYLTVLDRHGKELFTWSYPIIRPEEVARDLILQSETRTPVTYTENDAEYSISAGEVSLILDKKNGLLREVRNAKGVIPLSNGPVVEVGSTNFANVSARFDEDRNLVVSSEFDRKSSYNTLKWIIRQDGWVKLEVEYFPDSLHSKMLGVNFDFPEEDIQAVTYMGTGPYRVWRNRMKGGKFGIWEKEYNDTETGEQWVYPEFKGYHAHFYYGLFQTKNQMFTVATENEDIFLRLYSAAWKTDQWHNYEPWFPSGDISFMNAIPSIGSRTQTRETTGPMGLDHIYYDYEKDPARALKIVLWFNFQSSAAK